MAALFYTPVPTYNYGQLSIGHFKGLIQNHFELFSLIFIIMGVFAYDFHAQRIMDKVLENPRKSDFFYIDYFALDDNSDPRHRYVPMKIMEVNQDGIRFKVGNIAHATPVSPRQHAKYDKAVLARNYYRQKETTLSHDVVKRLVQSGAIYDARRPKTIYIDGWIVLPLNEMYTDDGLTED